MSKFDWNSAGPSLEVFAALEVVENELEFPMTYSGQAWAAAWRLWKHFKGRELPSDPWDKESHEVLKGMDLTGFMEGWAMNAVRKMRNLSPIGNPAILVIGKGSVPEDGGLPAEESMLKAIRG